MSAAQLSSDDTAALQRRASIGLALIGLGLLGILWGVFHVLGAVPKPEQLDFAHRTTDFEARSAVHATFFGGLVRALCGLVVALCGGALRNRALRALGRGE
jgi:hypothetical protein